MCNIGMRALVPVKRGGVDDTLAIRNDWGLIHMPCPVETAMGRLSRSYGECMRTQRRLFGKRRGTAVRFGDDADSLFVQLKLSEKAPGLGYVAISALFMTSSWTWTGNARFALIRSTPSTPTGTSRP